MKSNYWVLLLLTQLGLACQAEPPPVDTTCVTVSDCAIKDVRNCCGFYPRCVNKDWTPDPEAVRDWCESSDSSGVCGFPAIDGCICAEGRCQGTFEGATVEGALTAPADE